MTKQTFIILIFSVLLSVICNGQGGYPASVYYGNNGQRRSEGEVASRKWMYDNERSNARFDQLSRISGQNARSSSVFISEYPLDLANKAKKYVAPKSDVRSKFESFLKLSNTGISRLLPPAVCQFDSSEKSLKLEKIIERCPNSFIPGGARYFSFRKKDYVPQAWADIGFSDKWLFSFGIFNQGILVNLGDIPIDEVALSSTGMKHLAEMRPAAELSASDKQFGEYDDGVSVDGFLYGHVLPIELNRTYGIRVVAYKVDYEQKIAVGSRTVTLQPLATDKRDDVIVAFRVVDFDINNGVTLVWRELNRKDSPKLIIPK